MEAYAQVLALVIPGFVILILIEGLVGKFKGIEVNRSMDTISSLSSGMTNTLYEFLGLSIVIVSYSWMYNYFALIEIQSSLILYVVTFIGLDFAGYWSHRFNHVINVFWNRHIIHHSSEEFNLACALRQSISTFVVLYFFLLIPLAVLGVPEKVIAIVAPLHLFAQFWYHTRLIDKMGFLEHIIVTPSHHRVHHAINDQYIDRNFAQIFIVWDKMFGTFQEELPDQPPVYGVKKPVNTWNPFLINFMHMWMLFKDAWRAESWWDKIRLWFMPTGWRPADVAKKYPIEITTDVYNRPKYDTEASLFLKVWSWTQLVIHNLLMYYVMINIAEFNFVDIGLYSAFLMVSIFSYTTLMDRHALAAPIEFLKLTIGIFLIIRMGSWFGLDQFVYGATWMMIIYIVLSFLLTIYFSFFEMKSSSLPTTS